MSSWNYALYLPVDDDIRDVVKFVQGAMPAGDVSPYYLPSTPVHLLAKVTQHRAR